MNEIRVLSATGILGSGFREDSLKRGMALRPDFVGADSGYEIDSLSYRKLGFCLGPLFDGKDKMIAGANGAVIHK